MAVTVRGLVKSGVYDKEELKKSTHILRGHKDIIGRTNPAINAGIGGGMTFVFERKKEYDKLNNIYVYTI